MNVFITSKTETLFNTLIQITIWYFMITGFVDGFNRLPVRLFCTDDIKAWTITYCFMKVVEDYGLPRRLQNLIRARRFFQQLTLRWKKGNWQMKRHYRQKHTKPRRRRTIEGCIWQDTITFLPSLLFHGRRSHFRSVKRFALVYLTLPLTTSD